MIESERLLIRPFEEMDRDFVVELLQDPSFMEYSAGGAFEHKEAHERFDQILAYRKLGLGKQAVILKNIGAAVGYCGIEPFSLNGRKEYELGYRVVTKHRGMGIASEAAQLVANGFKSTLFAYVDAANTSSVNVLRKIGFIYQGTCILDSKEYELYKSSSDGK